MAKVLVHEVRRVVMSLEAAVDAVLELDRDQGGQLAIGTLVDARLESEPEPGLLIEVRPAAGSSPAQHRYDLSAIAAAFVHYCWKSHIPWPRQGTKRIAIVPEGIAITIELAIEVLRRNGGLPNQAQRTRMRAPPSAVAV